jgi:NADH-quinone oxidoreductase subunit K
MMNATALAFVVGGARWAEPDGQVMFVLVLTLQAAEACVGLALVIQLYPPLPHTRRRRGHDDERMTQ